ncbi:hypothetical protein [Amycolatopsis ultiminotia]|uniref:hypothetical protein n=1 Tax=Amycolatopsis ultiminotia TaxID=543629 RepID=UPI0031E864EE
MDLRKLRYCTAVAGNRTGRCAFDGTGLPTRPDRTGDQARLPGAHRPARRRKLRPADLDGEPIPDARARRTASLNEKFELVAAGRRIALVPPSVARAHSRSDPIYLPGGAEETP